MLSDISCKDLVHQALVRRACILQAERHFCVTEYSKISPEGCLVFVFEFHLHLMVSFVAIQKTFPSVRREGVNFFIDLWQGIAILWARLVKIGVIYAHAPSAI
ncbi:hypothetical protein Hanom_Chr10g00926081 [Helianthus anomalus]